MQTGVTVRHARGSTAASRRGVESRAKSDRAPAPAPARLVRRLRGADLRAVSAARHAMRDLLRGRGQEEAVDTAELLTSELVTNALVHTHSDAVLTVRLAEQRLRVEVEDFVPGRPWPRGPRPEGATGGRGLQLVQGLAAAWGVVQNCTGKTVWFELAMDTA